mmetsp:Transcript_12298/g.13503  ORF Transcript_12298/g.13503 Transcript_12298/m.13503 type:complete len:123 (+) Transcript_12298:479-847(+)
MAPPVSFSSTQSEVTAFCQTTIGNNVNKRESMNSINTNSYMNLYTCCLFNQYIDTTHYLCATSESEHIKTKGATEAVSPTSASSHTKKQGSLETPLKHQYTRTQTLESCTVALALTGGTHPL